MYLVLVSCYCCFCLFVFIVLGECWSGPGDSLFFLEGHAHPGQCADQCYNDCACSTRFCAGKNYTNAIYAISKAQACTYFFNVKTKKKLSVT